MMYQGKANKLEGMVEVDGAALVLFNFCIAWVPGLSPYLGQPSRAVLGVVVTVSKFGHKDVRHLFGPAAHGVEPPAAMVIDHK